MSHTFRFLAIPITDSHWAIADDGERHHCRKVLKLSSGAAVEVTDGHGRGARGVLCPPPVGANTSELPPNAIWLEVTESWQSPPPKVAVHLMLGAIKPGDWDQVLPPLAEIGVASVGVFACGKSAKFRIDDKVRAKAERIMAGAIKQSKRDYLPPVRFWPSLRAGIEPLLTAASSGQRFVLSATNASGIDTISAPAAGETVLVVGDEAGIDDESLQMLDSEGFLAVSFGHAIYRAKTAAICGAYHFRARDA